MYKRVKQRVYEVIQPNACGDVASAVFDWFIIVLIIVNVLLVILDTFNGFPPSVLAVFRYVEIGSVIVFTFEYLLRVWTADLIYAGKPRWAARLKFTTSFMALVDLFAILPFYLPFLIPASTRVLRMIRLLRLLRLLKVNRYTSALSTIGGVIRRKASQLISSMVVVFILMVMASVIMYNVEYGAQPQVFQNAFSGLWWAIATLTTVGYGDIYPITAIGKFLSAVIALLGIGLVAVPTGIISAGFMEDINHEKATSAEKKHYCPYCGKKLE